MSRADDLGIFAPWRFTPEGTDFSPGGWYMRLPTSDRPVGPFDTRQDAKRARSGMRKAWGLYNVDADGNRVVHLDGAFSILDRLDARDWIAGAVEAGERFAVFNGDDFALPDGGHLVETLQQALTVIEAAKRGPDADCPTYMERFPEHARPFCGVAYTHGFEDGGNRADEGPWAWVWGLEPGDRVLRGDVLATVTGHPEESKHGRDFAPCVTIREDGEDFDDFVDADDIKPAPEGA